MFTIFYRSHDFSMINNFAFTFLNIQELLLNVIDWLNISLSVCLRSRDLNRNISNNLLIIDNCISNFLLSINGSAYFFFSNNWSLYYSLFNDWLRDDSFGDNWLGNNFSFNLRLRDNFLGLHDLRSRIQNLIFIRIFISTLTSLTYLSSQNLRSCFVTNVNGLSCNFHASGDLRVL